MAVRLRLTGVGMLKLECPRDRATGATQHKRVRRLVIRDVAVLEDRLIRVINAVLIVVRPLRRPRAAQPREWAVVPACAPIVPLDWFGSDRGGTRCCGRRSRCAKD